MQYNITYRQKDKGIQVIVSYKDNLGKWKQKSKQGFKTKRDAKVAGDKIIDSLKENEKLNIVSGTECLTLGELKTEFLKHIKLHRTNNTYENYSYQLKSFNLDHIEFNKLTISDIQKEIDKMVNISAESTIRIKYKTFKTMLYFAHNQYNLPLPNFTKVVIPKSKVPVKKKRALNNDEFNSLIEYFKPKNTNIYTAILIAGMCGLRIGEIMGLTWDDIDFENKTITVNKQWKKNKDSNKYIFDELKSPNSYRSVPISDYLSNELQTIKTLNKYDKDNNRLIRSKNTHSFVSNTDPILKLKSGVTLHELRHTYATKLIANGVDFKTTAKLLGHDVKETMRVYSHVNEDMFNNAINIINKIF